MSTYDQTKTLPIEQAAAINALAAIVHRANKKWWLDLSKPCLAQHPSCEVCHGDGYAPLENRNVGELLMLCVSELSEALEGHRKNLPDDKLPHRKMFEVEIADCVIRLLDLAAGKGLDLGGAFVEKMSYNANRADHKIENRLAEGGKAY